jgi:hypothetical protein
MREYVVTDDPDDQCHVDGVADEIALVPTA